MTDDQNEKATEIDLHELNRVDFGGSLIYKISTDTVRQRVCLGLEIDATFHRDVAKLARCEDVGEVMVDLVCERAASLRIRGMTESPREWRSNEKPHHWEVAELTARTRRALVELKVTCFLGQEIVVRCGLASIRVSLDAVGDVHDYS